MDVFRRSLQPIAFVQPKMVSGGIILWSGSVVGIPSGYVLCDGNNGTPDLRNRFVVGAGDTYAVAASGGSADQLHTFTADGHDHGISAVGGDSFYSTDADVDASAAGVFVTGTTDNSDNRPPYYALCYIMKI